MNKKLQAAFPSGGTWKTHEGSVQSLEVNKDEITYIWDYSCNEDVFDEEDVLVGTEERRYYGEKIMQFAFLSGTEFSYNQEHKKFMLHIFFSGTESIVIGCEKKTETKNFYGLVKEWIAYNKS